MACPSGIEFFRGGFINSLRWPEVIDLQKLRFFQSTLVSIIVVDLDTDLSVGDGHQPEPPLR